ncbi:hypothetical protein FRC02_011779 [Tulasnella sp. 418]|nr:hypothetical protein FRC02_011779 [Tulasnella sp. 418]
MAATVAVQPVGYNHHHPVDNVPSLTSLRTALAMASITMSTAPPLTKNNADGNQQDGHRSSLQRADSGATSSSKSSGTSESLDDSTAETAPDHENEEDSPAPSYILPAVATATFPPAPSSSSSSSRPPSLKANAWRLEFRGVVNGSTMPRLGCLGALRDPRSKNSVPRAKSSKSKNQVSLIDALRLPDATPATMQSSLPEIPSSVNRVRAAHPYSDSPTTLHHPPGFLDAHQAQPTILIHHSEPSVLTLHNSRNVARNSDQDQTFWPEDDVTEADLDQEAARAEIETRKARRRKGLSLNSRINEQPDLSEPSTSFDTQRHNLLVTSLTSGTDQHTFSPASPAPSSSQDNHLTTRSDITHSTQQPAFLTPPPSNFDHSNASPIASPIQDETEPRNPPSRAKTSVSRRISLSVKDRLRRSFSLHNTFTPVTPPPPVPSRNPDSVDPPSMHETFSNIVSVKHSASTGMDHKLLNKSRRSGSLSGLSLRSIHQHDSENRVESPQNGENGRISKASTASGTGLAKLSRAMSLSVPASLRISTKHLYSHKDVPSGASTEPLPPLPPIPAISPIEKHFRDFASARAFQEGKAAPAEEEQNQEPAFSAFTEYSPSSCR